MRIGIIEKARPGGDESIEWLAGWEADRPANFRWYCVETPWPGGPAIRIGTAPLLGSVLSTPFLPQGSSVFLELNETERAWWQQLCKGKRPGELLYQPVRHEVDERPSGPWDKMLDECLNCA